MKELKKWSVLAAFCALAVCGCSKKTSARSVAPAESETIGMSGRMTVSSDGGNAQSDVAILVIDMQNDFVLPGAVLCVAGAQATIPTIQDLLSYGRSKGWHIIHVIREHRYSGCDVDLPRVPLFTDGKQGYCVRGTAVDAMCYDYNTVVCTDACSAKTPEVAEANIFDMKNMGIICIPLAELKTRL